MSTNVHDTEQQFHPALLDLAALQSSGTWSPTDAPSAAGLQTRQRQYQDAHFYRSRPGARASERPSHSRTRSTPKQQSHLNKKPLEHSNGRLSWSGVPAANFVDSSHPGLQFLRSSAPASSHNWQDETVPAGHAASDAVLLNAAEELEKLARSFRHEVAERKRARMAQLPGSKLTRQREQGDKASDPRRRFNVHKAAKSSVLAGYDCVVEPAQRIMSPAVSLDGLYAKFLEVYLPRNPKGDTATAVLSFLIVTPTVLPSPVIALEEAIRTLVMVSLGGATGNDVLLQQAVTHYGRALSSLRRSIARPQLEDYEHTFVAIMILLMCSHHNKIRTVDNGWVQHMWGAQHYFVARNSGSFQTKAGALALALARHASLSYSLLARKASIFAKSMANGFAPRDNKTRPNWSDLLFPTSLQIPTLLERLDALALSHQIDPDSIEALDKACSGVELRLRTWFREWTAVHTTIGIALFKEQRVERSPLSPNYAETGPSSMRTGSKISRTPFWLSGIVSQCTT